MGMKIDNPFDRALEVRQVPGFTRIAATDIAGNLELAWDLVRSVFEEHARPEHAVEVCRMFTQRADALRTAAEHAATDATQA